MTNDTKHRTLKEQLEAEIADWERRCEEDPDYSYGGDWQKLIMTWHCYDEFKDAAAGTFDDALMEQARQLHPEWCGTPISDQEFAEFAKALGGLMQREAYAIYAKHDFWCTRNGITVYADGS